MWKMNFNNKIFKFFNIDDKVDLAFWSIYYISVSMYLIIDFNYLNLEFDNMGIRKTFMIIFLISVWSYRAIRKFMRRKD